VTPRSIGSNTQYETKQFDLLKEFITVDEVSNDRLMIKGLQKERLYDLFESTFADAWDGPFYPLQSMTEVFETNKRP